MSRFNFIIAGFTVILLTSQALAHPADGLTPHEVSGERYASMGLTPEMNIGDITFAPSYPAPSTLSAAERYILTGAEDNRERLDPWYYEIYMILSSAYGRNGALPGQLSDQLIADAINGGAALKQKTYDRFKSPLTGRYPDLNAPRFSPGDMYVRVLSHAEVQHFTRYDQQLKSLVDQTQPFQPAPGSSKRQRLYGKMFYMRIYGQSGIILEQLVYSGVPVQ